MFNTSFIKNFYINKKFHSLTLVLLLLLFDPRRKEFTAGAAQGFILGPDIWNAYYDGILRMEMPDGCFLIGYADDVAALMTARDVEAAPTASRSGNVPCSPLDAGSRARTGDGEN